MSPRLLGFIGTLLLCSCAAVPPQAPRAVGPQPACAAPAQPATGDARIRRAIDEAGRQHRLFGGQTIERNGGMFRAGYHEAGWSRPSGDSVPTWQRVATFWQALSDSEPPTLLTSVGRVARAEASALAAGGGGDAGALEIAIREALLRAAIMDTPWSAAFISYLMKTAGFSRAEFRFSEQHADYVQAAFETSAAEAEGRHPSHAWRACDVATTTPRAGDLLCATRAGTAHIARFDALRAAMAARSERQPFPMHCDLVVRSEPGADGDLDIIGGNVMHSVTLSRMALNADRVLSQQFIAGAAPGSDCTADGASCRGHLSMRPWVVLLQFRH